VTSASKEWIVDAEPSICIRAWSTPPASHLPFHGIAVYPQTSSGAFHSNPRPGGTRAHACLFPGSHRRACTGAHAHADTRVHRRTHTHTARQYAASRSSRTHAFPLSYCPPLPHLPIHPTPHSLVLTEPEALTQRDKLSTLHAQLLQYLSLCSLDRRLVWLQVTAQ
jgi:hypothetical protein